jgi:hypothetical protein
MKPKTVVVQTPKTIMEDHTFTVQEPRTIMESKRIMVDKVIEEDQIIQVPVPREVQVPVQRMVPKTIMVPVTTYVTQYIQEVEQRTIKVPRTVQEEQVIQVPKEIMEDKVCQSFRLVTSLIHRQASFSPARPCPRVFIHEPPPLVDPSPRTRLVYISNQVGAPSPESSAPPPASAGPHGAAAKGHHGAQGGCSPAAGDHHRPQNHPRRADCQGPQGYGHFTPSPTPTC